MSSHLARRNVSASTVGAGKDETDSTIGASASELARAIRGREWSVVEGVGVHLPPIEAACGPWPLAKLPTVSAEA